MFLDELNKHHANIKFTDGFNEESNPFLDLEVKLSYKKLATDLFIKAIDTHQYLHYTSSQPEHIKRSTV